MKYKTIIETDDFKDFEFFEDGYGKYLHGIDAGSVNNEWIVLYFTECKQEDILDKIKAEIEHSYCTPNNDYDHGRNYGLYMATQIIDHYKAENEDDEQILEYADQDTMMPAT